MIVGYKKDDGIEDIVVQQRLDDGIEVDSRRLVIEDRIL